MFFFSFPFYYNEESKQVDSTFIARAVRYVKIKYDTIYILLRTKYIIAMFGRQLNRVRAHDGLIHSTTSMDN